MISPTPGFLFTRCLFFTEPVLEPETITSPQEKGQMFMDLNADADIPFYPIGRLTIVAHLWFFLLPKEFEGTSLL